MGRAFHPGAESAIAPQQRDRAPLQATHLRSRRDGVVVRSIQAKPMRPISDVLLARSSLAKPLWSRLRSWLLIGGLATFPGERRDILPCAPTWRRVFFELAATARSRVPTWRRLLATHLKSRPTAISHVPDSRRLCARPASTRRFRSAGGLLGDRVRSANRPVARMSSSAPRLRFPDNIRLFGPELWTRMEARVISCVNPSDSRNPR